MWWWLRFSPSYPRIAKDFLKIFISMFPSSTSPLWSWSLLSLVAVEHGSRIFTLRITYIYVGGGSELLSMCERACVELTLCVKFLTWCVQVLTMCCIVAVEHILCTRDRNICCVCFIISHTICAHENVLLFHNVRLCTIYWQLHALPTPTPPNSSSTPFCCILGAPCAGSRHGQLPALQQLLVVRQKPPPAWVGRRPCLWMEPGRFLNEFHRLMT